MKILAVSGSLRAESTNSMLLAAAAQLAPPDVDFQITNLIADLPLFSPDLDATSVEAVDRWVQLMRNADGLVLSTPEYARGYPGALKNAFDWLVQGDGFVAKPFMFLHASNRSGPSHQSLTVVLETMSGIHIKAADATIPLLGQQLNTADIVASADYAENLRKALDTFVTSVTR